VNASFAAMYTTFTFLVEMLLRISFGNVATEDLTRTMYTTGSSTWFKCFSIWTSQSRATKNSRRAYIDASTNVIFFQVEGNLCDPKVLFKIRNYTKSAQRMGHASHRTQCCAPSPLFQELAEILSTNAQKKPLSTLK
jgi:hypothetical protein